MQQSSLAGITIDSVLTLGGQSAEQTQYVGSDFVLSRIGPVVILFDATRGTRSLADLRSGVLRPADTQAVRRQAREQRDRVGKVTIIGPEREIHPKHGVIDRYRYFNHAGLIVVRGSLLVRNDPRIGVTALAAERAARGEESPFHLPLEPDQIVVESRTRSVAADFEQTAAFRMLSVHEGIRDGDWVRSVLELPVTRATAA